MKTFSTFLLILVLGLPALASEADFQAGMQAAAAKDWAAALPRLEAAVAADPDSLRNESEYRRTVIAAGAYERALDFYQQLATAHPDSWVVAINYGYAYVDKIPAAGSITQVILANSALGWFTKSLERKSTWLGLFTRGNSYLYWPKVFGKTALGIADLEKAVAMSKTEPPCTCHVRAWVALGDGYWKLDQLDKARAAWNEGLKLFPGNAPLTGRLAKQGDELKEMIEADSDPNKRVDTDLRPLWEKR
ncbi:MAG TPA: tetratricopeptide repeat protein [Thermoanaerobaculia bacterium]|nr:tetratricopeptide repeat protein [Thermoanaerobaculia bacterium]